MHTLSKLLNHCENIAGLTIKELAFKHNLKLNFNNKGCVGQLLELELGCDAKNKAQPDFLSLGIELKTIPINNEFEPLESTYVSIVNFNEMKSWFHSAVRLKLLKVLWIPILRSENFEENKICYPIYKELLKEDEYVLASDYEELCEIITFGDEPKASLGNYLQVRPKALNSKKRLLTMGEMRHPLGFYLRTSYTNNILKDFI